LSDTENTFLQNMPAVQFMVMYLPEIHCLIDTSKCTECT